MVNVKEFNGTRATQSLQVKKKKDGKTRVEHDSGITITKNNEAKTKSYSQLNDEVPPKKSKAQAQPVPSNTQHDVSSGSASKKSKKTSESEQKSTSVTEKGGKKEAYKKFRLKRLKEKHKKKKIIRPQGKKEPSEKPATDQTTSESIKLKQRKHKSKSSSDQSMPEAKKFRSSDSEAITQSESRKYEIADPKELLHYWRKYLDSLQLTPPEISDYSLNEDVVASFLKSVDADKSEFVKSACEGLSEHITRTELKPGAPFVMFVCDSAERVISFAYFFRDLSGVWSPKPTLHKLFSRHKKLELHEKTLNSSRCDVAVVTPVRALALLEKKALKTKYLKFVIIDWSFKNQKQQRLVDIKDTRKGLMDMLKCLNPRLKDGSLRLILM